MLFKFPGQAAWLSPPKIQKWFAQYHKKGHVEANRVCVEKYPKEMHVEPDQVQCDFMWFPHGILISSDSIPKLKTDLHGDIDHIPRHHRFHPCQAAIVVSKDEFLASSTWASSYRVRFVGTDSTSPQVAGLDSSKIRRPSPFLFHSKFKAIWWLGDSLPLERVDGQERAVITAISCNHRQSNRS